MSVISRIYIVNVEGVRATRVICKVSPHILGTTSSVECITRVNGNVEDTTQEEVDKLKHELSIFAEGLVHYIDSLTLEYMRSGDVVAMEEAQQEDELN
mgnify:CR=1 FL=1